MTLKGLSSLEQTSEVLVSEENWRGRLKGTTGGKLSTYSTLEVQFCNLCSIGYEPSAKFEARRKTHDPQNVLKQLEYLGELNA